MSRTILVLLISSPALLTIQREAGAVSPFPNLDCAIRCQSYRCSDHLPGVASQLDACPAQNGTPNILGQVALDDFQKVSSTASTLSIVRVRWWGTLPNGPGQIRFIIRVWSNSNTATCGCGPHAVVATRCVIPTITATCQADGTNCEAEAVYRFDTCLATPITGLATNTKYWLEVSENNAFSPTTGVDFKWARRKEVHACPAVVLTATGSPPPCNVVAAGCPGDTSPKDLAFCLYGCCLTPTVAGAFPVPTEWRFILPPWAVLEDPVGNEVQRVPLTWHEDGTFEMATDVPDGTYTVIIRGNGMKPLVRPNVSIVNGSTTTLNFAPGEVYYGELNHDGMINALDLEPMLRALLAGP
jgi:hypothetical protein